MHREIAFPVMAACDTASLVMVVSYTHLDVYKRQRGAGTQFDPELVPVFIELINSGKLKPVLSIHAE